MIIFYFLLLTASPLFSEKIVYPLSLEPIDVVIPCVEKDIKTLELCISGIRKNANVRRVIVVSSKPLTPLAEWYDERNYPFTKNEIGLEIFGTSEALFLYLTSSPYPRIGWIFQQLIKLYAPLVIPDISSNVLVLDADTIFLKPVSFQDPQGEGLYCTGLEHTPSYFKHAERLIPGFKKMSAKYSGIAHHMLFQRPVIEDLFNTIESYHQIDAWRAICRCIDRDQMLNAMSEFEIYFNFVFSRTDQMKFRPLNWENVASLDERAKYRKRGYHFISCHDYTPEKPVVMERNGIEPLTSTMPSLRSTN